MFVPQDLQRTTLPREPTGTASTFLQVSRGHIMRMIPSDIGGLSWDHRA